jgi:hypothetical protein
MSRQEKNQGLKGGPLASTSWKWKIGLAFLLATLLTGVGWGLIQWHLSESYHLRDLGYTLLGPGDVVAAIAAAVYSPQGVHGLGQFIFLSVPCTWVFYFLLMCWILFRLVGSRK